MGSILLWQLSTDRSAIQELLGVRASAPWCSLVIRRPISGSLLDHDGLHDVLSVLPGLPVFLKAGMSPVQAIRKRRPPTAAEVARYVECRPSHERLALQLRLLAAEKDAEWPSRTVRHRFGKFNGFGPRHWRWVIHLAQIRPGDHESVERLAARYDLEVRALRRRVRSCLDVSLDQFRQLVGWEWRVEAALRLDALVRGGRSLRVDRPVIRSHCP
jgi:hypothetical protein